MEKKVITTVQNADVLGTFLRRQLDMSRAQIRQAKFRENGILVNGQRSYTNRLLAPGDIVEVYLETPQMSALPPCPMHPDVHILYEDEDLIAVTKPAGLVIHPSHGHFYGSLGNMIADYFQQNNIITKIRPVGRLDKDTSGIMIFAKNQISAARLYAQKKDGRFRKEYLAIVSGIPMPASGTVCSKICKDETTLMKMKVAPDGLPAITNYQTLSVISNESPKCPAFSPGVYSLLSLHIETGRTHQIRVHMASIGHPLLGDPLYNPRVIDSSDHTEHYIERTALHAWKCSFYQPFTQKEIVLTTKLPNDMQKIIHT